MYSLLTIVNVLFNILKTGLNLTIFNKKLLTKGQPGLIWELQASVSAVWFQGHIFPE